jgi:hypothetical protein
LTKGKLNFRSSIWWLERVYLVHFFSRRVMFALAERGQLNVIAWRQITLTGIQAKGLVIQGTERFSAPGTLRKHKSKH